MAQATYVAEDGVVGHQWEFLGLRGFNAQCRRMPEWEAGSGRGSTFIEAGGEGRDSGFLEYRPEKGIAFEM